MNKLTKLTNNLQPVRSNCYYRSTTATKALTAADTTTITTTVVLVVQRFGIGLVI